MKKIITSFLLLALPLLASAYDVQIDGIYYNLIPKGNAAEVTCQKYDASIYPFYFSDYSGVVTIPDKFTYKGMEYSVNAIADCAFYGCSGLISVTIPNSVTSIGKGAFNGCSSLSSITIPNSVTIIGDHAFHGCIGLIALTLPNSITTIEDGLFYECSALISVTIPNSVNSIESSAFWGCTSLTSVTIPNSVAKIDSDAFAYCTGLTSVNISDLAAWCAIDFVDNPLLRAHHLFLDNIEITNLTIPEEVTCIKQSAFSGCSGLTSVTIPNSVTSIEKGAFSGCSGLTSITIPNSVTSIGNYAFSGCSSLISFTIPNTVTSIGRNALWDCCSLTSLTIPNSVITIGEEAFYGCSGLISLTIGSGVKNIYNKAFAECSKLEEVYCLAEKVPSSNSTIFEKSYPEYTTLYVPVGSLNDYKTTEPWSQFGTIKAINGTGEEPTKCATPTISYADKKLTFSCETEGVEYHYTITDSDIKSDVSSSIDLSATYEISVYATKSGYTNSDVATATLVWTDAIFTETTPETPTSAKEVKESIPVLISANGGVITVKSEQEGQAVAVYTADGKALGSANVKDGQATVATNLQRGEIVIVKVGGRSVKVKTPL